MAACRIPLVFAASLLLLLIALPGRAAPDRGWLGPAGIGRVRVELLGERMVVTTDLTLPVMPGSSRALEIHAAYGAPATPLAADAELVPTPRGFLVAPVAAKGTRITSEHALVAAPASEFVLGRARMAGRRVRATAQELENALAPSGIATLRLRELRALPPPATNRAHQVLIRLGTFAGEPLLLGSIELEGAAISRQQARLCGSETSPVELWVHPPRGAPTQRVAPPLAPRSAGGDLCIDFWRTP
jgi:hypothetical protein